MSTVGRGMLSIAGAIVILIEVVSAEEPRISFAPRLDTDVTGSPVAVVALDFNGDADTDVAVACNDTD